MTSVHKQPGREPARPEAVRARPAASTWRAPARFPTAVAAAQAAAGNTAVSAALRKPQEPVAQRVTTIDGTVEQQDVSAITRVLAANDVLRAAWMWILDHKRITFTISALGMNSFAVTTAVLPGDALTPGLIVSDLEISVKLAPINGTGKHSSPASVLEQVSHELNLHLLPWVRVMMFKESQALDSPEKLKGYPPEQLTRVGKVLGYSGDLATPVGQERLRRDLAADKANKALFDLTGKKHGNHSDIGLWLLHLRTLANLAELETTPWARAALVSEAIPKVSVAMAATGDPKMAIVRDESALSDCHQLLDGFLITHGPHVSNQALFGEFIKAIKKHLDGYAAEAKNAQQVGKPAQYAPSDHME